MSQDVTRPVWNKVGKRRIEPMLIGTQLHRSWRSQVAEVTQFRFTGPLQAALLELSEAARRKQLYLPVTSLRTTLALTIEDLVGVNQDLGMGHREAAAIETYRSEDVQGLVMEGLANWASQQLMEWAGRHDLVKPVMEVSRHLAPDNLLVQYNDRVYANDAGHPDFPIIVRDLADRLIGEELFEELGPCRFVATGEARSNSIELTTDPQPAGDSWYSMVATLSVVTVPYALDPLLKISAQKRNWTSRAPKSKSGGPKRFRAYVYPPTGPCVPVWVDRKEREWVFSDDYAFPQMQSLSKLPSTIDTAVQQVPVPGAWWVGLPELPVLFGRVAQRTVFESDEKALLDRIRELVAGLAGEEIAFERHNLGRRGQASKFSMIKMEDIAEQLSIQGIAAEEDDESFDEGDAESDDGSVKTGKLSDFRKQNERVLDRLHGNVKPSLWVFGGNEREQEIVRNTVSALFGDRIECILEVLPAGTHGRIEALEPPGQQRRSQVVRFQARADAWRAAVGQPDSRFMTLRAPKYALIVAPDEFPSPDTGRLVPEDPVNYYAGIHALSALGANVHHCLPIDESEGGESRFLQRVQSSLLDVLFAHSGLVLGVEPFLKQLLEDRTPRYVHGVQVMRSLSRAFTSEKDVRFIAFTRLDIETGRTELQIAHPGSSAPTPWKPMDEALRWLGSQTTLAGRGGESWLEQHCSQFIKSWLVSVGEVDPLALVLIDWSTLAGRWKGIRDQDLRPGSPPKIDGIDLATAFPQISFVRIRRGADSLSLRSVAEQSYESWLEGEERQRTGEVLVDSYLTTTKCLAELPNRGHGRATHFVASMGYQQSTQPRGLSCYRSVTRMVSTKDYQSKRTGRFEPVVRTPASGDQAIPAALEITVLSCPPAVEPSSIAKIVMGLRLGYAHYGEWTSVPAPLFFRRKIDDYIIRYVVDGSADPEGPDLDPEPESKHNPVTAAIESVADQYPAASPPGTEFVAAVEPEEACVALAIEIQRSDQPTGSVSRQFEEQVLRPHDAPADAISAQMGPTLTIDFKPRKFDPKKAERPATESSPINLRGRSASSSLATLQELEDIKLPALYRDHSKLYWMLLRGDVKVQVDLPSFATEKALFEGHQYHPNKRDLKGWWQTLQKQSVVKPRGPMVDGSRFWEWHFRKLRTPQSTWYLNSVLPLAFKHIVEPVLAIKQRYQAYLREIGERPSDHLLTERTLEWVVQTGSDEDLAWLIFDLAHRPTLVGQGKLVDWVRKVPGPLTREAIDYMARVSSALLEAIETVERGIYRFTITRSSPTAAAPCGAEDGGATSMHVPNPPAQDDPATPFLESSMQRLREDLILQVMSLKPGSDDFDAGLLKAGETLEAMRQLHLQQRAQAVKAREDAQRAAEESAANAQRLNALNAQAQALAIRLVSHGLAHAIPEIHLETLIHEPLTAYDSSAEEALAKVVEALEAAEIAHAGYEAATQLMSAPRLSLADRRSATLAQLDASQHLEHAGESLRKTVLEASPILRFALERLQAPEQAIEPAPAKATEAPATASDANKPSVPPSVPEISKESVITIPAAPAPAAEVVPAEGRLSVRSLFPEAKAAPDEETMVEEEAEPSEESAAVEDEPAPSMASEEDAQEALEVLQLLCGQRRYELAKLQVDAIVKSNLVADLVPHSYILKPLFGTLHALDCRFTVNPGFDPALLMAIEGEAQANKGSAPEATAAGILAASLPFLLFGDLQSADRSTILGFVQPRLQEIKPLAVLVQSLWDQAHKNISPTREKLAMTQMGAKAAVELEIKRFQQRAAKWLDDPLITTTFRDRGAKAINYAIYHPASPIGALLAAIAQGDNKKAEKLREDARRILSRPSQAMTEGVRAAKERTTPDGMYRQRILQNVEVTASFVNDYFALQAVVSSGGTALSKTEKEWIISVFLQLRDGIEAVKQRSGKTAIESIYFSATQKTLSSALRLFSDDKEPPLCVDDIDQRLLLNLPLGFDFNPSYDPPEALCVPEEVLAETKRLSEENLDPSLPPDDDASLYAALKHAAGEHLKNKRFRPAYALRDRLGLPEFTAKLAAQHRQVREDLRNETDQAGKRVAHALSLSSINQAEANQMLRDLSEIDKVVRTDPAVGNPNCEYSSFPDVPHVLAALRLRVTNPLDLRLAKTRSDLVIELEKYEAEHPEHAADIDRIRAMLDRNSPTDIRAADDALLNLRNYRESLPSQDKGGEYVEARYERFIFEVTKGGGRDFLDALQVLLKREPLESDPLPIRELDAEGRADALRMLTIWADFTKSQLRPTSDSEALLERFFTLIGSRSAPQVVYSPAPDRRRVEFQWMEPPFVMPSPGLPPELGSLGLNIRGFLIRGGDSEIEIQQAVSQSYGPTVLLARGRFGMEKRAKLCSRHPVLLVDDYLAGWISVNASGRLAAMLEIALLTFTASPYADFGGKPVPPEMFYGREKELRQLRAVQQSAVLYGGRRLGKSSLLDQIQRDYAKGNNQAKAVYLSVDAPETTAGDHVTWAWRELLKKLISSGVLPSVSLPKALAKDLAAHIEQQLQSADSPIRDLFLLIDEADQLMEFELELPPNAPSFVRMLQKMCESLVGSKIRVRYVLAGLHNVARMTTEVNSPLGKAESIALEPFGTPPDLRKGMELITQPLEALGFRFEHDDLPWRIMSMCNFYPAFIQLWCKTLLDFMYNKRQNGRPPTKITAQDLDSVERDEKLLSTLQEKFALNLNLDKRYKAIALILADRYYSSGDSQQGLTAVETREFCELVAAPHFKTTGPGAYEALLDEMKKLNMLERVGARYVLRNPNIAMMMGDKAKVIHDLDELAREKVVRTRSTGERRVTIHRGNQALLFPMPAGWIRTKLENAETDAQLLILVGNRLSGLYEIASERGDDWALCGEDYHYTFQPFRNPQDIDKHIRKLPVSHKERLIAVSPSAWKVSQIGELVTVAQKAAKRKIRIALIANTSRVREMLTGLPELQKDSRFSIEPVPSWSEDAIFFHTRESVEISDSSALLQAILTSTGGFGVLVDRLTRERSAKALPDAIQTLARGLETDLSHFYKEVGMTAIEEDATTLRTIADFASAVHGSRFEDWEEHAFFLEGTKAPKYSLLLLQWMGLLLRGKDGKWEVPEIYRNAIKGVA